MGVGLVVCFGALFAMLNYVQVLRADDLNAHPGNSRALERDFDQPRGSIVTRDGFLLAQSVASDDDYEFQRIYPEGELFGHVTGHFGLEVQSSGLERQYNDVLAGATIEQQFTSFRDLFVERDTTGNLTLSLRRDVQAAARDALGGRRGSVVVIVPQTGEILALWSFPSYDPNLLADHDDDAASATFAALEENPGRPLLAKSYRERFFPGSTFKVVTGSSAVDFGLATLSDPDFPAPVPTRHPAPHDPSPTSVVPPAAAICSPSSGCPATPGSPSLGPRSSDPTGWSRPPSSTASTRLRPSIFPIRPSRSCLPTSEPRWTTTG